MKRETVIVTVAALAAFGAVRVSAAQPAAVAAPVAIQALEEARCEAPSPVALEESAVSADAKKCEDFGFFAADKKKECEQSCKRGRKCQKKERCGGARCPEPGYCWKCG